MPKINKTILSIIINQGHYGRLEYKSITHQKTVNSKTTTTTTTTDSHSYHIVINNDTLHLTNQFEQTTIRVKLRHLQLHSRAIVNSQTKPNLNSNIYIQLNIIPDITPILLFLLVTPTYH